MAGRQNIDHILRDWPYDPSGISVRMQKGKDGRQVLQMRLDLGLLQLETAGRPDGSRPFDRESALAFLRDKIDIEGDYTLSEDECAESDREFTQYYYRRICWLALKEFAKAVLDADHTLSLMDLCRDHSPDEQWTLSHEQYRPFVLFHRTQAAALSVLETGGAEAAIHEINEGLEQLRQVFAKYEADDQYEDDELVQRLTELRESLRQHFKIGRTLEEQLSEAIADEKYELAAELRDELAKRNIGPR